MLLVMLLAMFAVPSAAQAIEFTPTDHLLGRSHLDPANVSGAYDLAIPAGTTDGAEIKSTAQFRSGTVSTRLKVANAPSSITGFFLYAPPDLASEIDIEIYNDPSGTVMYSTYAGGRQTHTVTQNLGFDPTAAFHAYAISWANGQAQFTVDGKLVRTFKNAPKLAMNLYVNAWFPSWLGGLAPLESSASSLTDIAYLSR
jgi:beta-glucanase (GH16 family)